MHSVTIVLSSWCYHLPSSTIRRLCGATIRHLPPGATIRRLPGATIRHRSATIRRCFGRQGLQDMLHVLGLALL